MSTDERRFHCSDKAPKRNSYRKKDGSWLTVSKSLAKGWIAALREVYGEAEISWQMGTTVSQ